MLHRTAILLKMIKFSHTVFALPFALMATFLAANGGTGGFCGLSRLLLVVLCAVSARTVAMTFNRIVDARIDAANPRTADRAIPTRLVGPTGAWLLLWLAAFAFGTGTLLFYKLHGNPWPAILAVPVLLFICLYSLTKRFTQASHFWLGASLALAPLGAWIAVCPPAGPIISAEALLLAAAVLCWTAGFDIIYACQDIAVDRRDGLHSLPANLGVAPALWVSRVCHAVTVALLVFLAIAAKLGAVFLTGVAVTALLLALEHVLVRRGRMARIKIAFGTLNGLFSILLALALIVDVLG